MFLLLLRIVFMETVSFGLIFNFITNKFNDQKKVNSKYVFLSVSEALQSGLVSRVVNQEELKSEVSIEFRFNLQSLSLLLFLLKLIKNCKESHSFGIDSELTDV